MFTFILRRLNPRLHKMAISVVLLKTFVQSALGHFSGALSKGVVLAAARPGATASATLAPTYRIEEHPAASAVVLRNIAEVLKMATGIFVVEKIWP
jgi:predicted permease